MSQQRGRGRGASAGAAGLGAGHGYGYGGPPSRGGSYGLRWRCTVHLQRVTCWFGQMARPAQIVAVR